MTELGGFRPEGVLAASFPPGPRGQRPRCRPVGEARPHCCRAGAGLKEPGPGRSVQEAGQCATQPSWLHALSLGHGGRVEASLNSLRACDVQTQTRVGACLCSRREAAAQSSGGAVGKESEGRRRGRAPDQSPLGSPLCVPLRLSVPRPTCT